MAQLEGKVAFVSGGNRGIGYACALDLAKAGADIFLAASNPDRLTTAAETISQETGRQAGYHAADLRTLEGCNDAADAALSRFGRCDILINSAGATKGGIFPDQPDEEMIDGFALKFHGAVRLTRFLWPALKASHGTVINIVGGFARTPAADFTVGGAVNAALANFSKALAAKGLDDDVNVNWVHPGLTVTERLEEIFSRPCRAAGYDARRDRTGFDRRGGHQASRPAGGCRSPGRVPVLAGGPAHPGHRHCDRRRRRQGLLVGQRQQARETEGPAMAALQVEIGERYVFSKTVSESDIYMFAGITGDFAPQHVNRAYMEATSYGGRIAHGALIIGYMSTASSMAINGKPMDEFTPVSLGYDRIRFVNPVFLDDTVTVEYVIESFDPGAKPGGSRHQGDQPER